MNKLGTVDILTNFFNYQVISLMGIILNIIGSIFLATEAIGLDKFSWFIDGFRRFSKWYKKSLFRMTILILPFFVIMGLGIWFNVKVLVGLFYPLLLLIFISSFLIDQPDFSEKWLNSATKEKRIGPYGFVIFVFGGLLQLISVIWQMALEK